MKSQILINLAVVVLLVFIGTILILTSVQTSTLTKRVKDTTASTTVNEEQIDAIKEYINAQ